jgi:hypothetical protein
VAALHFQIKVLILEDDIARLRDRNVLEFKVVVVR